LYASVPESATNRNRTNYKSFNSQGQHKARRAGAEPSRIPDETASEFCESPPARSTRTEIFRNRVVWTSHSAPTRATWDPLPSPYNISLRSRRPDTCRSRDLCHAQEKRDLSPPALRSSLTSSLLGDETTIGALKGRLAVFAPAAHFLPRRRTRWRETCAGICSMRFGWIAPKLPLTLTGDDLIHFVSLFRNAGPPAVHAFRRDTGRVSLDLKANDARWCAGPPCDQQPSAGLPQGIIAHHRRESILLPQDAIERKRRRMFRCLAENPRAPHRKC